MDEQTPKEANTNPDPVTHEPGSHPIGAGVGAAGGGLAGAAIGAAVGGPVGAAVGAVVGGVAGAYSGKSVAEAINPTQEDEYWREHHHKQEWAGDESSFEHYKPAYKTGYEGVMKYVGKRYHEVEANLARDYEKNDANPAIPWDRARPAVRAAWDRLGGVAGPRDFDRGMRGGI